MEKLENNILQLISAVADTPGTLETREQDADRAIQQDCMRAMWLGFKELAERTVWR